MATEICCSSRQKQRKIFFGVLDTDRVVKEKDISTVEQYIPLVIHYVLEDDQAEILDSSFVKIFRISQLAIEYLLFCKKYLDNTVVLLKKEILRLKQQMDILQQNAEYNTNLSPNPRREFLTAVFKCEKCEKAFSSDNYLNSHIKRRHNGEIFSAIDNEDKLQSEIKELKERLNSTVKLLQQIHVTEPQVEKEKTSEHLLIDLEKKFCSFREQVDHEIASLHLEKNMYEEKYNKLFDLMLKSKEKPHIVLETTGTMTSEEAANEVYQPLEFRKTTVDNFTQTIEFKLNTLTKETVQNMPLSNAKGSSQSFADDRSKELESKLIILTEDMDNKISSSMNIIKDQMQTFWEQMKKESTPEKKETLNELIDSNEVTDSTEIVKPQIKPRKKLLNPSKPEAPQQQPILTPVRTTSESIIHNKTTQIVQQNQVMNMNENIFNQRDSVIHIADNIEDEVIVVKTPEHPQDNSSSETDSVETANSMSDIQCRKTEVKNIRKSNSKEQRKIHIIEEINKIIDQRFQGTQSFTVSRKKFHKAMEILSKYQHFKKRVQGTSPKHEFERSASEKNEVFQKKISKTNTVRIRLNRTFRHNKEISDNKSKPIVEIKNKSLYDTDSETDRGVLDKKSESETTNFDCLPSCDQINNKVKNTSEISPSTSSITKKVLFEDFLSDEQSESEIATTFGVNTNR